VTREVSILVAGEGSRVGEAFSSILRDDGYRVREARTGAEVLQSAHTAPPDVILLGARLPDLSGIEVCRRIKAEPALAEVVVILVSEGVEWPAQRALSLEVGADDHLAEPVAPHELRARIGMALRLRAAAAALHASGGGDRRLLEILPEALCILDSRGRIVALNPRAAALLGCAEMEESRPKNVRDLVPARARERLRADIRTLSRTGILRDTQYEVARKDGSFVSVEVSAVALLGPKGRPRRFIVVARDITERKRWERASVEASEREQRLVGETLHDDLCQRLFSTAVGCSLLREKLEALSRPEAAEAAALLSQLHAAISEARGLAHGLSLASLGRRGLGASLAELASTISASCHVACAAECAGPDPVSNAATATHLYRIAQEAVYNAVKHAKPSRILIRLEATASTGRLSVVDDGCGIPQRQRPGSGIGLDVMRYRANMIGAQLDVRPAPSGGTIVSCDFTRHPGGRRLPA